MRVAGHRFQTVRVPVDVEHPPPHEPLTWSVDGEDKPELVDREVVEITFSEGGHRVGARDETGEVSLDVTVIDDAGRIKIETDPPVAQGQTRLAITAEPKMPEIRASAVVLNGERTSELEWTGFIDFSGQNCPPSQLGFRRFELPRLTGEEVILDFGGKIRGGFLTFVAGATFDSICSPPEVQAGFEGPFIDGTNPPRSDIQDALLHNTLRRIACKESGQRQFDAPPDGGVGPCPLFGVDGVRVGVMQIPNPTDDEIWNWRENVKKGIEIFNEGVATARAYPNKVRSSARFQALVDQFNQKRQQEGLDPIQVLLSDFTGNFDDVLQPHATQPHIALDAIRGYNGFHGEDRRFGIDELHEFRVAVDVIDVIDGEELLQLRVTNINEQTLMGEAVWERVPVAERPVGDGNPNYVEEVLAFLPDCSSAPTPTPSPTPTPTPSPCEIRIDIVEGAQTTNVGQRIRLRAVVVRPSGGSITSLTWHIQGTAIRTYAQALAAATVTNLTPADLTSHLVELYWIDGGTKTVRVDAVVNGTSRCSASVTFTLIRPAVLAFTAARGVIAISTAWNRLGLDFGTPARPGITWTARVRALPGSGGSVAFLQLVTADTRVTVTAAAGGGNLQRTTGGAFLLDTLPPSVFYASIITPISGGTDIVHAANDSPGLGLTNQFQDSSDHNTFQLYLMYRPTGAGNIWVSLACLDWGWCARATLNAAPPPPWVLNGPSWSWHLPFVITTQLPVWTGGRVQDLPVVPGPAPVNCAAAPPSPPPTPTPGP